MTTTNPDIPSLPIEKAASEVCRTKLEEVLREGAIKLLTHALENEVAEYLKAYEDERDEAGRRQVVRHGYARTRTVQSPLGPFEVRAPRVHDRREGQRFTSAILPPYLRKTPALDSLVPVLYLKGVSDADMASCLAPILGENAAGLSAANVRRLREQWAEEMEAWMTRDLSNKQYVYLWADGVYFNVRLTEDRPCLLVLVGSLPDGTKELVGIYDGVRESKLSWLEMLRDLKKRGLSIDPKLAVGDGALGFWGALEEVFPSAAAQRCWVHKTANVLDKLPKSVQEGAKKKIHDIYLAPGRRQAEAAFDDFEAIYAVKYPRAWECLAKDRDRLLAFYGFPAEHWAHIRSTNPIESLFATVRHRHRRTKGNGSRQATLTMVCKLAIEAEKKWRRLNGYQQLSKLIEGVVFTDGIEEGIENPLAA